MPMFILYRSRGKFTRGDGDNENIPIHSGSLTAVFCLIKNGKPNQYSLIIFVNTLKNRIQFTKIFIST